MLEVDGATHILRGVRIGGCGVLIYRALEAREDVKPQVRVGAVPMSLPCFYQRE